MSVLVFTQDSSGVATTLIDVNFITNTVDGVESTPNATINSVKLTGQDGEKFVSDTYDKRPITVAGTLKSTTAMDLRARVDSFKRYVAGAGTLDVTFVGETSAKRYRVRVQNISIPDQPHQLTYVTYTIVFVALDPPFGEDISSTTLLNATGVNTDQVQSSDLDGSAEPNVNVQITVPTVGNLTGIEFANDTTSTGCILSPTFAANDVVVINTGKRSAQLNGLSTNFAGQVPRFQPDNNDWRVNFRTTNVTVDQEQDLYTSDRYAFGTSWLAQSFQTSGAITSQRVDVMLSKLGSPTSVRLDLYTDSGGHPGSAISGANATVLGAAIQTSPAFVSFNLNSAVSLGASTTYWIVVRVTGAVNDVSDGIYWKVSTHAPYANGSFSKSTNSGSAWTAEASADAVFRVWKTGNMASNTNTSQETYQENFTTTTNEDTGTTTANWNTTANDLELGPSSATDTGYKTPTTTPSPGLLSSWTSPSNAFVEDGSFATVVANGTGQGQSYGTFGLGVPAGAVITGMQVLVKGKASASTSMQVLLDGGNGVKSVALTTTNTQYSLGGPGDLWGYSPQASNFADGNFYLFISTVDTGMTLSVDGIQLKVFYTAYDTTKNLGQSLALNASGSSALATVYNNSTSTYPPSTSIGFLMQSDATGGFTSTPQYTDANMPITALGTAQAHKWKATLNTLSGDTPKLNQFIGWYRKAMPLGATTDRLAQSFSSGAGGTVPQILLNLVKTTADTINYTVEIQPDSSGHPSGTAVTNGSTTILAVNVPDQASGGAFAWVPTTFATPPSLSASTTYWIVIKVGTSGSSQLLWRARGDGSYASGAAKYSVNSGSAYTALNSSESFLFQVLGAGGTFSANVLATYKPRYL